MKPKRLLLFVVLCLIPTLAQANPIDFSTGVFSSGTLLGNFSSAINVNIVGSLNTIDIITGTLVKTTVGCPIDSTCFDFNNGSVKVSNSHGTEFFDSLSGGITIEENGSASLDATLSTSRSLLSGSATATFEFTGNKITGGSADVSFQRSNVVPEPSSLSFLGLGLVSIGTLCRTKLWRRNVRSEKRIAV